MNLELAAKTTRYRWTCPAPGCGRAVISRSIYDAPASVGGASAVPGVCPAHVVTIRPLPGARWRSRVRVGDRWEEDCNAIERPDDTGTKTRRRAIGLYTKFMQACERARGRG